MLPLARLILSILPLALLLYNLPTILYKISIMGEAPPSPTSQKDHLLLLLPGPEPTNLTTRLRHDFTTITVTYHQLPSFVFTSYEDDPTILSLFKSATMLITPLTLPPPPISTSAPHLRLVHTLLAGVDKLVTHPLFTDTDIPITSSSGVAAPQIGEWVMGTRLAMSHRVDIMLDQQRQKKWERNPKLTGEKEVLVGQTVGVLGYGSIGRQCARLADAAGMRVLAFTARPRETREGRREEGKYVVPGTGDPEGVVPEGWWSNESAGGLGGFLKELDWLVISLPLTKRTVGIVGKEEVRMMGKEGGGKGAFVSNISRGQILDQGALVQALRRWERSAGEEGVRGAALDVAEPEPLPVESELWEAPNLLLSPHVSGEAKGYVEMAVAVWEENMRREERGEGLLNLVDRKRGY